MVQQLCFDSLRCCLWLFLQILCDLLSPADENVKVGLRETAHNTLPHLRSKTLMSGAQAQPQSPVQRLDQVRTASAHLDQEVFQHSIMSLQMHGWIDSLHFKLHRLTQHRLNLGFVSSSRNAGKVWSGPAWAELTPFECTAPAVVKRVWREFVPLLSSGTRRRGVCWRGSCQCQTLNPILWTVEVASIKNKVSCQAFYCTVFLVDDISISPKKSIASELKMCFFNGALC